MQIQPTEMWSDLISTTVELRQLRRDCHSSIETTATILEQKDAEIEQLRAQKEVEFEQLRAQKEAEIEDLKRHVAAIAAERTRLLAQKEAEIEQLRAQKQLDIAQVHNPEQPPEWVKFCVERAYKTGIKHFIFKLISQNNCLDGCTPRHKAYISKKLKKRMTYAQRQLHDKIFFNSIRRQERDKIFTYLTDTGKTHPIKTNKHIWGHA